MMDMVLMMRSECFRLVMWLLWLCMVLMYLFMVFCRCLG